MFSQFNKQGYAHVRMANLVSLNDRARKKWLG